MIWSDLEEAPDNCRRWIHRRLLPMHPLKRWLRLNVFHWCMVEVPIDSIGRAGGISLDATSNAHTIFNGCDQGVERMRRWCRGQCRRAWDCTPNGVFYFASDKDAAIFKLRWY